VSPGDGERGSASLYRCLGEPPAEIKGVRGAKLPPPEAKSFVSFEAAAEEPNLTLVTAFTEIWQG